MLIVLSAIILSTANVGTTRPPLATDKRGLHLEYKHGKSTDRPEISVLLLLLLWEDYTKLNKSFKIMSTHCIC